MSGPAGSSAVNLIPVRMGEMTVSRDPRDVISVVGLGSCVAVVLIAPEQGAMALAHVVLPESRMTGGREAPAGKFADTAVTTMLNSLKAYGVAASDTYAILVGGATMFGHTHSTKLANVGERNIAAARVELARNGIGIASEEVGGTIGRSVNAPVEDLEVHVRSGIGDWGVMPGSDRPIAVKVSELPADLEQEPFPEDIWNSSPVQTTP